MKMESRYKLDNAYNMNNDRDNDRIYDWDNDRIIERDDEY